MSMTHEAVAAWLEKYGRAWEARNANTAADLYTEDGTYQVTPLVEPMRGRAVILEYWKHVAQTEESIRQNAIGKRCTSKLLFFPASPGRAEQLTRKGLEEVFSPDANQ